MATQVAFSLFLLVAALSSNALAQSAAGAAKPAPAPAKPAAAVPVPPAAKPAAAAPPAPAPTPATATAVTESAAPHEFAAKSEGKYLDTKACSALARLVRATSGGKTFLVEDGAGKTTKSEELREAEKQAQKEAEAVAPEARKATLKQCGRAPLAKVKGGAGVVGAQLVQAVAQVVVDKVQRQGWVALQTELKKLARCGEKETWYPETCEVLGTVAMQDLVSAPNALLDAVAADVLATAQKTLAQSAGGSVGLDLAFGGGLKAMVSLQSYGTDHLAEQWIEQLLRALRDHASQNLECKAQWTSAQQAGWVAGMCFIERPSAEALSSCDIDGWLAACGSLDAARVEKSQTIVAGAKSVIEAEAPSAEASIRLSFAIARAHVEDLPGGGKAALKWLGSIEDLVLGLVERDWVRAMSGASRTAVLLVGQETDCKDKESDEAKNTKCEELKASEKKLIALFAATGNYAFTYKTDDPKQAQADRTAIIRELVDRLVNRTDKTSGAKISLGGNLGLVAGTRTDLDDLQAAFPVQLGLGLGLQTYHSCDCGFHLMATALDVGQYVNIDNDDLNVSEPDVESSVMLGLTAGAWLVSRELPFYIAAYGGISPFVQSGDDPTYQFGLATGFYVPLLDLN